MTWYKTGTVAVTSGSNAVIGTGTSFIANSRVGDAFRGPDGGWYEVTNIASDTALSIAPNYQGATVAAGGYSLAPMQGYVKDSADALRAATQVIGQVGTDVSAQAQLAEDAANAAKISEDNAKASEISADTAASTSTAAVSTTLGYRDEAEGFRDAAEAAATTATTSKSNAQTSAANAATSATDAANSAADAAASTVGKANSGANSDITSLSGLTTPLSVGQGGTGSSSGVANMVGATASVAGTKGLVPAPTAGATRYLSSLGTWLPITTSSAWGSITGTLSAQTDLQAALDAVKVKRWRSGNLLLTTTPTTFTHTLGIDPDLVNVHITLTVALGGWAIGTTFRMAAQGSDYGGSGAHYGVQVNTITSAYFRAMLGASGFIILSTSGASQAVVLSQCTVQVELLSWQ